MKLLAALRQLQPILHAEVELSRLYSHRGVVGQFREGIVKRLLRPHLPQCFGIGSGEVFSEDGQSSKQIDVVLYDAIFSNALFKNEASSLFPCESIYGTIEIKSTLNADELRKAIDNIKSVKSLSRKASDMCDLSPISRLKLGDGLGADPRALNPYIGMIFAYDGISPDRVVAKLNAHLESNGADVQLLPDFIFVVNSGYCILRTSQSHPARLGATFDKYMHLPLQNDTLPLFILTLNTLLNCIRLRAPDYESYWRQIMVSATTSQSNG